MAVLKYYNTATSAWEYIAASTTANFTTWKKTATGGETSVSGTDDNAVTLSYTVGLEQVFINGVLQVRGTDYVATTGTSITGLTALVAGDIVTVVCYAPFNIANTIAPTLVDAKGDLIAGTAADTVGRLAVGTNGQMLVADSTTSTGLKWTLPGKVLQVSQTNNSTQYSSTSTAYPPTAYFFQGSITPKSTTSTIYCFAVIYRYGTSGGGRQFTDIKYNTTSGDSSGTSMGIVSTGAEPAIDSRYSIPAVFMKGVTLSSTSTHYFKVVGSHGDRDAAATWYVNPFSDLSTITLIEVEA